MEYAFDQCNNEHRRVEERKETAIRVLDVHLVLSLKDENYLQYRQWMIIKWSVSDVICALSLTHQQIHHIKIYIYNSHHFGAIYRVHVFTNEVCAIYFQTFLVFPIFYFPNPFEIWKSPTTIYHNLLFHVVLSFPVHAFPQSRVALIKYNLMYNRRFISNLFI